MAGSFSGNLLGTFSGRGADVSPMQFIQEMRQRAIQAEQQKKMQQQQMAQSFTMALMARKQQEAEMAQQGAQFQAQQQQRIAEKNMAGEQFRSEQDRLREAQKAQDDLRKLGEARQLETERRLQSQFDETRGLQRAADDRRALGRNVQTATIRGLEQRFAGMSGIPGFDPLQTLDTLEASALEETKSIDDPEAQAIAVTEIRQWRAEKEAQLGRRESLGSMIESRRATADDRALRTKQGADADKNKTKVAAFKAELAGIQDDLKMWAEDLLDSPGNADIQKKLDDARKRRNELYKELAAVE